MNHADAFLPAVPQINMELGSRCNLTCPYCANSTLKRPYEQMSPEIFDRIVAECAAKGYKIIAVHGVGEPLLRHDLAELLAKLMAAGVWNRWITTNGTLLTVPRLRKLIDAGLAGISVSMDTLDSDLYARTRGGKVEKAIANIKAARAAFPDLRIVVTLMNHKEQTVDDGVRAQFRQTFGPFFESWSEYNGGIKLTVQENGHFPGSIEDWRRLQMTANGANVAERCRAPASFLTIDARGLASLCCVDQNTEHVLGDVKTSSIEDIWYSDRNQDTFRRIFLGLSGCPEVCYKCVLKKTSRVLEDVEPILYAPLAVLVDEALAAESRGQIDRARMLMDHAQARNPYDGELQKQKARLQLVAKPVAISAVA
jgi:MoaA/NifB/PqqE/SkfB family radical SAM enzyme